MSIQRQTYLVVGFIVLLGVVLGFRVSRWWLLLPTIMGVGMLVAAAIGFCNMTRLLSKLPWNEPHSGRILEIPSGEFFLFPPMVLKKIAFR